jgi:aminoglycoside 2'-N-acetyltransferase I
VAFVAENLSRLVRVVRTDALGADALDVIRRLLVDAFADVGSSFEPEDWDHALGGTHAVVEVGGRVVAHASVVPRTLEIDGVPLRGGYVEAVATRPNARLQGHASAAMRALAEVIAQEFEVAALSTGLQPFYERLGWERWPGTTGVRTATGIRSTPEETEGIMVLRTRGTPPFAQSSLLVCDWREGDFW